MRHLILTCCIIYCNVCLAQTIDKGVATQEEISLGYSSESTRYDYRLLKHNFDKNQKQLCFFDIINDSVIVTLNDRVISNALIFDSSAKLSIVMVDLKNRRANVLKIILYRANKFIEFPLDPRYRFVEIFYNRDEKNDNDIWNVNFTNNVPHRY